MKLAERVEQAEAAFLREMRDRRLLKYLFQRNPDEAMPYGHIERPLDANVQAEIANAVVQAVAASLRAKEEGK